MIKIEIPILEGLNLSIGGSPEGLTAYPTSRLSKGLMMNFGGQNLGEEAVGFGLPVIMTGFQTIFPGHLDLTCEYSHKIWEVTAVYQVNLIEKIIHRKTQTVKNRLLYITKNYLAAAMRNFPASRKGLTTISNHLRRMFAWETGYELSKFTIPVKVVHTFKEGSGNIKIDYEFLNSRLHKDKNFGNGASEVTEVILMNEQGANAFDQYRDSAGTTLIGSAIGCWDEVTAQEASFSSTKHRLSFNVQQVDGARLFRGRELIGTRLAWSGFGYSFPPTMRNFCYSLKIAKLA